MRCSKILILCTAAAMALGLTACGSGQLVERKEVLTGTCQYEGNTIEVSTDVSDGWTAAFDSVSVRLYDPEGGEAKDPVAVGLCEGADEYAARLPAAAAFPSYTELENGVAFTDSAGLQEYILDLGENVH